MENGFKYRLVRSSRRSLSVEVGIYGDVTVRVPRRTSQKTIDEFLRLRYDWIVNHIEKARKENGEPPKYPSDNMETIRTLGKKAAEYFPERVKYYAEMIHVSYGRITIRNQKTRWGSCSSKGNLNFNCLLMLCPPQVRDYVIVHELCHRLEMNHSAAFWKLVEGVMPDYKLHRKWLKENGNRILR